MNSCLPVASEEGELFTNRSVRRINCDAAERPFSYIGLLIFALVPLLTKRNDFINIMVLIFLYVCLGPELEYHRWLYRTGKFGPRCLLRVGSYRDTFFMGMGILLSFWPFQLEG